MNKSLFSSIRGRIAGNSPPDFGLRARHVVPTAIASADDDVSRPTRALIELSLEIVRVALDVDMSDISARIPGGIHVTDIWPGEHYKLLAAAVLALSPKTVIEIGTSTGLSALAMMKGLQKDSSLVTFDILSWTDFPDTSLKADDFSDGRLVQRTVDLADPRRMLANYDVLTKADLIFVDGPKDSVFEPAFLNNLKQVPFAKPPLIIVDDVRLPNMLSTWRNIDKPKLDLTSFGHWSGTGIILWT